MFRYFNDIYHISNTYGPASGGKDTVVAWEMFDREVEDKAPVYAVFCEKSTHWMTVVGCDSRRSSDGLKLVSSFKSPPYHNELVHAPRNVSLRLTTDTDVYGTFYESRNGTSAFPPFYSYPIAYWYLRCDKAWSRMQLDPGKYFLDEHTERGTAHGQPLVYHLDRQQYCRAYYDGYGLAYSNARHCAKGYTCTDIHPQCMTYRRFGLCPTRLLRDRFDSCPYRHYGLDRCNCLFCRSQFDFCFKQEDFLAKSPV